MVLRRVIKEAQGKDTHKYDLKGLKQSKTEE